MGYHLRLDKLYLRENKVGFDYEPPVDKWFNELPEVTALVETRIREWSKRTGRG